ncbi:uncharacterized protein [Coffea arabica]|uniref:Reverse transcriptase/retrotransposon-derived protein RNase H-like domain-containing protein n=1 Tax=Coffea arabica TaxID=13443 RepID=A0ABM4VYZ0_COFAR
MATNGQQFGERQEYVPRKVNEIVINRKQNASAIILKSGKKLPEPSKRISEQAIEKEEVVPQHVPHQKSKNEPPIVVTPPPSFPNQFAMSKKEEQEQEILKTFCKVEVNISLLDTIKQIPRYEKFLKELCTTQKKLKGNEKVHLGENISAVLQKKFPPKCKDPGMFTIPYKIKNIRIEKAMLNLGASINVMPRSIYNILNLGPLKEMGIIIQLANKSNAYLDGVLEDILVQVDKLIFPANFYVLDMKEDNSTNSPPILLERPFFRTSRTNIDVYSGTLTMEFDGNIIKFNIYDAMKYPNESHSVFVLDVIDFLMQQTLELTDDDVLKATITSGIYRRFIRDFPKISHPLCQLLQKDVDFNFDEACKVPFDTLKESLISAPVVQPPNWSLPFKIMCDASNYTVSVVLGQKDGRASHVIYYASRILDSAQCNYLTMEKELLAIVFTLAKFRLYLLGAKVIVYYDHAALKYLFTKWILLLQEFDLEIRDKRGAENLVADDFSRLVTSEKPTSLQDNFPEEHLLAIHKLTPWYADIVNDLVTKTLPNDLSGVQKDKIKSDAKHYVWDEPYF